MHRRPCESTVSRSIGSQRKSAGTFAPRRRSRSPSAHRNLRFLCRRGVCGIAGSAPRPRRAAFLSCSRGISFTHTPTRIESYDKSNAGQARRLELGYFTPMAGRTAHIRTGVLLAAIKACLPDVDCTVVGNRRNCTRLLRAELPRRRNSFSPLVIARATDDEGAPRAEITLRVGGRCAGNAFRKSRSFDGRTAYSVRRALTSASGPSPTSDDVAFAPLLGDKPTAYHLIIGSYVYIGLE